MQPCFTQPDTIFQHNISLYVFIGIHGLTQNGQTIRVIFLSFEIAMNVAETLQMVTAKEESLLLG